MDWKLVFMFVSGNVMTGVFVNMCSGLTQSAAGVFPDKEENPRVPSNIRVLTREESIQMYWDPPSDNEGVSFCSIEYKDKPTFASEDRVPSIIIPVANNQHQYVISGLNRETDYLIKLYCFYGNSRGPSTGWIRAVTRTECPGAPPHAFLEPDCIARSWQTMCKYTCMDNYRKTGMPSVWENPEEIYVFCVNGSWVFPYSRYQISTDEVCLPEEDFHKCPLSIPNGRLEPYCGPGTDWLCDFTCEAGYQLHPFFGTAEIARWIFSPKRLFCEDGSWTTGYENLGVDISSVCTMRGPNCPDTVPNGRLIPKTWSTEAVLECNHGYRMKTLATSSFNKLKCVNGVWNFQTTIYDPTITPENACEHENSDRNCPPQIPNGVLPSHCKVNCKPNCSEGYYNLGDYWLGPGPRTVTCENGKWEMPLYYDLPYGADNACYPDAGIYCPENIPHGNARKFLDAGQAGRWEIGFRCDDGYRRHRGVDNVECVAGRVITWQERFGIDVSRLCIPTGEE